MRWNVSWQCTDQWKWKMESNWRFEHNNQRENYNYYDNFRNCVFTFQKAFFSGPTELIPHAILLDNEWDPVGWHRFEQMVERAAAQVVIDLLFRTHRNYLQQYLWIIQWHPIPLFASPHEIWPHCRTATPMFKYKLLLCAARCLDCYSNHSLFNSIFCRKRMQMECFWNIKQKFVFVKMWSMQIQYFIRKQVLGNYTPAAGTLDTRIVASKDARSQTSREFRLKRFLRYFFTDTLSPCLLFISLPRSLLTWWIKYSVSYLNWQTRLESHYFREKLHVGWRIFSVGKWANQRANAIQHN